MVSEAFAPVLDGLDRAALLEPMRQALGDATVGIDAWEARHLGQFNGAYLGGGPLPAFPWLSTDWVRKWSEPIAASFDPTPSRDPPTWAHPLVRVAFPEPIGKEVIRLWTEREQRLWEAVLAGYCAGLADAGWCGDDRLLAVGASALAVVRWDFFIPAITLATALDERRHASTEQRLRRPLADSLNDRAALTYFVLERPSAACAMLQELI